MQRLTSLNLVPQIGRSGVDINPCTRPDIKLYKDTLSLAPINEDELTTFKDQFATLMAGPGSEERRIQLDRVKTYVIAMRAIKHELGDPMFTGIMPEQTELGMGIIRPVFLKANTPGAIPGTSRTVWTQVTAIGFTDWIMDGAAAAQTIGNSFGLVITHLMSLTTPVSAVAEILVTVGRTGVMVPWDTRAIIIADNLNGVSVMPIPTLIVKPRGTIYAQARADIAGADQIAPRGLVFGLGRALAAVAGVYPQL